MFDIISTVFFVAVYFFIGFAFLTTAICIFQVLTALWFNWIYDFRNYMKERKICKKTTIYPMCASQPVQLDCRVQECKYYKSGGYCTNAAPAITLNPNGNWTCWTKNMDEEDI